MRISNLNLLLTVIFSFFFLIDFYIREHNAILRPLNKKKLIQLIVRKIHLL